MQSCVTRVALRLCTQFIPLYSMHRCCLRKGMVIHHESSRIIFYVTAQKDHKKVNPVLWEGNRETIQYYRKARGPILGISSI